MHWVSIVLNEWLRCISTNEAPNQPSCYQINQGENKIRAQEEKLDQQIGPKYLSLRHFLPMGQLLFNQLLLLIIHPDKYKSYIQYKFKRNKNRNKQYCSYADLRFWIPVPLGGGEHLSMTMSIFLRSWMHLLSTCEWELSKFCSDLFAYFECIYLSKFCSDLFASAAPAVEPTSCLITSNSPWRSLHGENIMCHGNSGWRHLRVLDPIF